MIKTKVAFLESRLLSSQSEQFVKVALTHNGWFLQYTYCEATI